MTFREMLKNLGFATYAEYLASDHWRAFRMSYYLSGKRLRCRVCSGKRVQLHHHTYERLGRESLDDVTPLCREHHVAVHEWLKGNNRPVRDTGGAVAFLRGEAIPPRVRRPKPERTIGWRACCKRYTPEQVPHVAKALRTARLSKNQRKAVFRFYQVKTGQSQTGGKLNKRLAVVLSRVLRDRPEHIERINNAGVAP